MGFDMNGKGSHHAAMSIPSSAHSHDRGHGSKPGHHDDHEVGGSQRPHHGDTREANSADEDCCSDDVAKLLQEEKNIAKSITIDHPVHSSFYAAPLYNVEVSFYHGVTRHTRYFVRNYHPPIPDIRVAIQSFQI